MGKKKIVAAGAEVPGAAVELQPVEAAETIEGLKVDFNGAESTDFIDFEAEVAKYRGNRGRRCLVVPFYTTEWVPGTIWGVSFSRTNKSINYAVKLDDGKKIFKSVKSKWLKVLDELDPLCPVETRGRQGKNRNLTSEEVEAVIKDCEKQIGKVAYFKRNGSLDAELAMGRIRSITHDKRSAQIMYRIQVIDGEGKSKFCHKNYLSADLDIAPEFDDEGEALQKCHSAGRKPRKDFDPERRLVELEAEYDKAIAKIAAAEERAKALARKIEDLKASINGGQPAEPSGRL